MAFVSFLMIDNFSGIISNTVRLMLTYTSFRRNLKNIYLFHQVFPTKTVFPRRNPLWLLTVFYTLAILSGQVGFEF